MDIKELYEERSKLFHDLYGGIIPKRVPISVGIPCELCMQNANLDLGYTQWTQEGLPKAIDDVVQYMKTDTTPSDAFRVPLFQHMMGSTGYVMSRSGFIQHPEISTLHADEYDEFIANPYDCLIEKILPRIYTNLDTDPLRRGLIFAMALQANTNYRAERARMTAGLQEKYGFFSNNPAHASRSLAPFDFISDYPRGFSNIVSDIKRYPEKVIAATEAVLPMLVHYAKPAVPSYMGAAGMPGHMPTFMRTPEFEKFFYPSFYKLIHATAENGQQFSVFCEDNWMRYLDHLYDLPQQTRLYFEFGDPQLTKDKLGKKHILGGFYPITLTKTGSKQQCIDKAKELVDIMAPGGNYWFCFDKSPLTLGSTNLENFYAVLDYVAENAFYDNAGEASVTTKKEDTITATLKDLPDFKSKYYVNAADYEASLDYILPELHGLIAKQVQSYEDSMFRTILGFL
ncbi:MAG: uroporphyrinogen decarboxylase [Eubacteriaceae bacterium]|nr:uroporphyrinogen decarboxylase [Eubacteriaceae bacterium]